MSDGRTVIYLGSFSRLLLPSLRISYMVLPPLLLDRYRQLGHLYNQTSSTIEQLALADFIATGALRRHVKRLRRLYSNKNTLDVYKRQHIYSRILSLLVNGYLSYLL